MPSDRKRLDITYSRSFSTLSDEQISRMAAICTSYFDDQALMEETVRNHLRQADTVRLACHEGRIVGFSIASKHKMLTPFYPRRINVIFQRMLYLDPAVLYLGIGLKLLAFTMTDLLGWWWPFRRFAAICRTQNPVVAKIMNMYDLAYPQPDTPLPAEIREFAESLLPILGAKSLDERCRLVGTLESFAGRDYTDIWYRYLHRRHNEYEELMLHSAFREEDGRIVNSGAFVLMIAYAKPLRFIRYLNY